MPKMIEITAAEYERLQDCIREDGMRIAALIEENKALHQDAKHLTAVEAAPVMRKHCDFCGRGKPIKAFTTLPDCGLQYGTSIMATYCPNCGAKMDGEGETE